MQTQQGFCFSHLERVHVQVVLVELTKLRGCESKTRFIKRACLHHQVKTNGQVCRLDI